MLKGRYCALTILYLASMSGCAFKLKPATDAWDQPKPNSIRLAKNWGPAGTVQQQATFSQKTPNQVNLDKNWQVSPPSLIPGDSEQKPTQGSIVDIASRFIGTPYVYGGESPSEGFDCSGLVQYVYALKGITLRRLANEQFLQGQPILSNELQPGDLVFFSTTGKIVDHVGIYAGDRLFIHAPRTGRTVSYDSLDSTWFSSRFQGARRVIGS